MSNTLRDEIDVAIVRILAQDGRTTSRSLSRLLPISEGTARLRLKRLLTSDIKVRALVNPSKVGFSLTAAVGLKIALDRCDETIRALAMHPRVSHVAHVTGPFDALAHCMFRSPVDMADLIEDFGSRYSGIKEVQVSVCLVTPLGHFTTINPGWASLDEPGLLGRDNKDIRIIGLLGENGRLTARDIAAKASLNEASVRRHLKHLLADRVITVRALVSPEKIGFPVAALVGLKVNPTKVRRVATELATHRQLNYVTTCAGMFDVFFVGLFRSTRELSVMLQQFVARIDGINETQTFVSLPDEDGYFSLFVPHSIGEVFP